MSKTNNDGILAIEEHQRGLNIDNAVYHAVIQYKGWASGKKVSKAVFEQAVESFLKAPMGGE